MTDKGTIGPWKYDEETDTFTADVEIVRKARQWVPEGFRDEDGVWHDGPHRIAFDAALDRIADRPSKRAIQERVEWWITDFHFKPPELQTDAYWRMMAREIAEYAVGEME